MNRKIRVNSWIRPSTERYKTTTVTGLKSIDPRVEVGGRW